MNWCACCGLLLPTDAFPPPRSPRRTTMTCRACVAEAAQIRRHGLTSLEKTHIAAAQNGCATCGRLDPGAKGWVVDHDHACCSGDPSCADCRRGVLCQWCNNALGYANDDPVALRRMADYLELGTRVHPDVFPKTRTAIAEGIANALA